MDFNGYLELIWGPMFSGKTTTLLSRLLCDSSNPNRKILFINSNIDTRSTRAHSTHNPFYKDPSSIPPNITMKSCDTLPSLKDIENYDNIYIDEAQFFGEDLVKCVIEYVDIAKKHVTVSGLVADSNRHEFGNILCLVTYADKCTQLHNALCVKCFDTAKLPVEAIFTHKLTPHHDASRIESGGSDKYIPLCRKHYLEYNS